MKKLESHLVEPMDIKVGLLIGYDCHKALVPRDIIPPQGNGPYGQATDLGWRIVGVINHSQMNKDDNIGTSHRPLTFQKPPV